MHQPRRLLHNPAPKPHREISTQFDLPVSNENPSSRASKQSTYESHLRLHNLIWKLIYSVNNVMPTFRREPNEEQEIWRKTLPEPLVHRTCPSSKSHREVYRLQLKWRDSIEQQDLLCARLHVSSTIHSERRGEATTRRCVDFFTAPSKLWTLSVRDF